MSNTAFKILLGALAMAFVLFFTIVVIPPLLHNPDIFSALAAGFVNPYAAGYSTDVILCWFVLAVWVVYEAKNDAIKYGWVCLLLGLFPGVVVGLALYLILRTDQIKRLDKS